MLSEKALQEEFLEILEKEEILNKEIIRHEVEEMKDEVIILANQAYVLEKEYNEKKHELAKIKAKMNLSTNWSEAIGKEKPTVNEKESFIELQTDLLKSQLGELEAEKNLAKRLFDIHMKFAQI